MDSFSNPVWRADFQRKYLSRLMADLHRRRIERGSSSVGAVKSAAEVSLAMAARGRTAWSRAIILSRTGKIFNRSTKARRNLKYRRNFHLRLKCLRRPTATACNSNAFSSAKKKIFRRLRRPAACRSNPRSHGEEEQGVESRLRTLRTLVPGSRGLDTPVLLEEVADYIMALKMQVESMQTLANCLENSDCNRQRCLPS